MRGEGRQEEAGTVRHIYRKYNRRIGGDIRRVNKRTLEKKLYPPPVVEGGTPPEVEGKATRGGGIPPAVEEYSTTGGMVRRISDQPSQQASEVAR